MSNNDKVSARTGTNITAFNPQIETSDKNVYVVWENHNKMQYANKSDVFMKKSTDGGDTFFGTFGVNLSSNIGASINPQIAISGSSANNVYVVWQDTNIKGSQDVIFSRPSTTP